MPNTVYANNYYCDEKLAIGEVTNDLVNCLLGDKNISPIKLNNKLAYKVNVVPTGYGSERVIKVFGLEKGYSNLELSFDFSFDDNFDFAKGGKLLGLGPEHILSGGMSREGSSVKGWSVRAVFGKSGALGVYYYLPNDKQTYGNFFYLNKVNLKVDEKYKATLSVALNTKKQNGKICFSASQYNNGNLQPLNEKCKENLIFSNDLEQIDYITKLLFSFFHGGHSISYRPKAPSFVNFYNLKLRTKEGEND
ncbi:polysaccharide lyase [Pseudoalteromonas prydzensis]|uniref:polysaccharide lyase n=1 Tax=Pseudoalteromonas prydzensis TaxID=182141 RepID=UPI003FD637DE